MRELRHEEQDALGAFLGAWHLEAALVTLVDWGNLLDDTLSQGQSHPRLESWNLRRTADPPPEPPETDTLRDFAIHPEEWQSCSVLDLLHAIETLLDAQWQTRRASCLRVLSARGSQFWIVRKHAWPRPTRSDRMPHSFANTLKLFHVVPHKLERHMVQLVEADRCLDNLLVSARAAPTAYLVHFEPDFRLRVVEQTESIQVVAIGDERAHTASVLSHLAAAGRCTFMVIPECTMPLAQRAALAAAIGAARAQAPLLTLAGSFHDPQANTPQAPCLNTAEVLDHRGHRVLQHVKTASAALRTSDKREAREFIETHNTVHALVTSLGLVGVAICIEFSHPDGHTHAAWSDVAPEWMLVASMGEDSTLALHRAVANQLLGTHHTTTLVANQSAVGGSCPGFVADGIAHGATAVNRRLELQPKLI